MTSLKKLQMKKADNILNSFQAVKNARIYLEQKTEKKFRDFDRSKQNIRDFAHKKYLG